MPRETTSCAVCEKKGKGCRRYSYCLCLQAESASSQAAPAPLAAAASAGASRSKRERKKVQKFEPEGRTQADYTAAHRKRKLKDATFAPKGKKM